MYSLKSFVALVFLFCAPVVYSQQAYREQHRPQIHFSPQANWMNDPNGMVYHRGTYHLFYQYHPGSTKWGPMHWGHATSTNLVQWKHHPIALYPDSLGTIFSGSAVVDKTNTSGFGKNGQAPLVVIFTHHNVAGEGMGRKDFQNQSIAFSNDHGKTWIKYKGNPVVQNPGIVDFRDPKVIWFEPQKKWVMTLATKDRIAFYSAPDLKNWRRESEFGATQGAHGGVWECPDLFAMDHNGKKVWVLLVNLNPGGPNGGSATQYFLGDFDGKTFTPMHQDTRWLDYGPDEYAGITWSNTGTRKIFLGWMSNWMYADKVPTEKWRSAMTIPRDLFLKKAGGKYLIASQPAPELKELHGKTVSMQIHQAGGGIAESKTAVSLPCRIDLKMEQLNDFTFSFSNEAGEELVVGYNSGDKAFFIDRTRSGKLDFHKDFAAKHIAPRLTVEKGSDLTLLVDVSSVELFADQGLSVMTSIFFPAEPYNKMHFNTRSSNAIKAFNYTPLKSIWH